MRSILSNIQSKYIGSVLHEDVIEACPFSHASHRPVVLTIEDINNRLIICIVESQSEEKPSGFPRREERSSRRDGI